MMNNKEKKALLIFFLICILLIFIFSVCYKIKLKNNLKIDKLIDSNGIVYENVPFEYKKLD